jgi:hypothetical protein
MRRGVAKDYTYTVGQLASHRPAFFMMIFVFSTFILISAYS